MKPHVLFAEAVLGQDAGTTVIMVNPSNYGVNLFNCNANQLYARVLHKGIKCHMGFNMRPTRAHLMAFVAGNNAHKVAQHIVPNTSGEMQLDLTSCILSVINGGRWVLVLEEHFGSANLGE